MSGYSELGGSLFSQGLSGFLAQSLTATEDIAPTREILTSRARILDMSVPIARAAVDRIVSGVVGAGLIWDTPNKSDFFEDEAFEQYLGIVRTLQRRMRLWSMSHACDAQRRMTLAQMQRLVCRNWLLSGDVFLIRRPTTGNGVSDWRIIESDRCATPISMSSADPFGIAVVNPETGYTVIDGVELDGAGAPIAYHFRDAYDDVYAEYTRIPAFSDDGLPLVLHVFTSERPDQYRGVPLLAPVIETIYGTACYAQSELQAAIIESCFSMFFETDTNPAQDPFEPEEDLDKPLVPDTPDYKLSPEAGRPLGVPGMIRNSAVIGPGESRRLRPGEKVHTVDPKRPNSGFEAFMKAQNGMIAAAIGVPLQVLQSTYDGTTYASARAATVEAWRTFKIYRNVFIELLVKPMLEVFARETLAELYPDMSKDMSQIIALESTWTGPSAVCLDPTKELQAYQVALEMGLVSADEVAQSVYGHPARSQAVSRDAMSSGAEE